MATIEHNYNVIEIAITNAALVLIDNGGLLQSVENIFQLWVVDFGLLLVDGFEHKVEEALIAQVRIFVILNRINKSLFPL